MRNDDPYLFDDVDVLKNNLDLDENKYKTIDGIECEKYDSRPYTAEKLKTIKSLKDINN